MGCYGHCLITDPPDSACPNCHAQKDSLDQTFIKHSGNAWQLAIPLHQRQSNRGDRICLRDVTKLTAYKRDLLQILQIRNLSKIIIINLLYINFFWYEVHHI